MLLIGLKPSQNGQISLVKRFAVLSSIHTVQLWFCPLTSLDDGIDHLAVLRSTLNEDELAKVDRYRFPNARLQALYVRNYLRLILTHCARGSNLNIAPEQWRFKYGSKGKPHLCDEQYEQTGMDFNISHSGGYLLVAVVISGSFDHLPGGCNTLKLGVDIEESRPNTDIHAIHQHYFSQNESTRLLALPMSEQRRYFFDLWALKESYIKATGKGLSTPLHSFGFDMSNGLESKLPIQPHGSNLEGFEKELQPVSVMDLPQATLLEGILLERVQLGSISENSDEPQIWKNCMGRIGEEYRYAVSLCTETPFDLVIQANWLESSQLLAALRS